MRNVRSRAVSLRFMDLGGRFYSVVVWIVLFAPVVRSQTLLRMTAGEARSLPSSRLAVARSARIDPPLPYPFRFEPGAAGLRVTVPPATPPGVYRVALEGAEFTVAVEAIQVPRAAATRVPVVLLNGFQFLCSNRASTLAASRDTFGLLGFQLVGDGSPVLFFNNCAYGD